MQKLRGLHLYLGCFFAPMIIFYAMTGVGMEFGVQGYAFWLRYMAALHMGQRHKEDVHYGSSLYLQGFVILMGLSLIATTVLGVVLAFKYGHGKMTLACMAAGILFPLALILIFGH